MAESENLLQEKILLWKKNLEVKELKTELWKTKVLKCHGGDGEKLKAGKWPCGVCNRGVGTNSIQCSMRRKWIPKKCSKSRES